MTMAASYRNFHHHPPPTRRTGHELDTTLQAAALSCAAMVSCGGCKREAGNTARRCMTAMSFVAAPG